MSFLAKLFSGDVPLWRIFWLIGLPIFLVWDVSVGCILAGCGLPPLVPPADLFIAGFLLALSILATAGVAFISIAIWRSAMKFRRHAWWEGLLVFGTKVYAALTGLSAFAVLFAILYGLLHYAATGHL